MQLPFFDLSNYAGRAGGGPVLQWSRAFGWVRCQMAHDRGAAKGSLETADDSVAELVTLVSLRALSGAGVGDRHSAPLGA